MNRFIAHLTKFPKLRIAFCLLIAAWLILWIGSAGLQWYAVDLLISGPPLHFDGKDPVLRNFERIDLVLEFLGWTRIAISIGLIGLIAALIVRRR